MPRCLTLLLALWMAPGCLVGPPANDDGDDGDDDDAAQDTEAPTVLGSVPTVDQAGVSPAVRIEVQMSEDIAASSSAAITVDGAGGGIPANSWVDGAFLLLEPSAPLAPSQQYTVWVEGSGVEDLAGNVMAESYGFQFTTAAGPPPTLIDSDPSDGEEGVEVGRMIALSFSAPIAPASVTSDTVRVFPDRKVDGQDMSTTGMPGTLSVSDNVVRFTPSRGQLQEFDTGYVVDVAGITNLAGTPVWTSVAFRTVLVDQAYLYRIRNAQFSSMLDTYDGSTGTYLTSADTGGSFWWFTPAFDALQLRNLFAGESLFLEGADPGSNSLMLGGGQYSGQHWSLTERVWEGGVGANESPVNYRLSNAAAGAEMGLGVIIENTTGNHDVGLETLVSGSMDQEWYLVNAGLR